jgi:hypothetical protein
MKYLYIDLMEFRWFTGEKFVIPWNSVKIILPLSHSKVFKMGMSLILVIFLCPDIFYKKYIKNIN